MRALFVNENIGGHATVHHHLRIALRDHPDVQPVFIDVPRPSPVRRVVGTQIPGLARFDLDFQPLRAQLALSRWVRRRIAPIIPTVDVVHIYTQNAALLSTDLLAEVPTVLSTDSTNVHNAYRLPYRSPGVGTPLMAAISRRVEQRVYGSIDHVVANSTWIADSLRDDYGVPDQKLTMFPFGIVAPDFDEAVAPGTRDELPRIVFLGRQLERKGGLRLFDLHQRHLADRAELVLVTKDPVPAGTNVTVVDDLDTGQDRLWEILRSSAIFAFPSSIDQAPNSVLEAMAAGLPVIGERTGAVPEMVEHDVTGLICDIGDDKMLLESLESLVGNAQRREDFGRAGSARFASKYDARSAIDRLVSLLRLTVEEAGDQRAVHS